MEGFVTQNEMVYNYIVNHTYHHEKNDIIVGGICKIYTSEIADDPALSTM